MKMKIPRSVNVLGHDYKIRLVAAAKLGAEHDGVCCYPEREIILNKECEKELRWLAFLHELRHAVQFESGLVQLLGQQSCETDADQFASFISSLQKQGIL